MSVPSLPRSSRRSRHSSFYSLRRSSSISKKISRESVRLQPQEISSDDVWILDGNDVWTLCHVISQENSSVTLRNKSTNETFVVDSLFRDIYPHSSQVVPDMTCLPCLSEPTILHNLQERCLSKAPYTFMGSVLVSVNPFEWYDPPDFELYIGKPMCSDHPHPCAMAELSYQQICMTHALDQSVVISGESGAGKTETAKMVLSYVVGRATGTLQRTSAVASRTADNIEERLLQSSPILEAFGNAKTLRNPNSSRFGKYMKIYFYPSEGVEKHRRIAEASVETYLLEKSRVVGPSAGERNFHIFYTLLAAKESLERSVASISLSHLSSEEYLILCPCATSTAASRNRTAISRQPSGVSGNVTYIDQYQSVEKAMRTLRYTDEDIIATWRIVAGILELGNITFQDVDTTTEGEQSKIENPSQCSAAATLLGFSSDALAHMLTKRTMATASEKYTIALRAKDSFYARNALAKALYALLFSNIVDGINLSLDSRTGSCRSNLNTISVLDIFGFESFERNEFEQLLINYANEALQNTFNEQVFQHELKLFEEEQIRTSLSIEECPSNTMCVNMIYGGTSSIITTLQSVAQLPQATDEMFCDNLHKILGNPRNSDFRKYFHPVHPKDRRGKFIVRHFAGKVEYSVGENGANIWLMKNHDATPDGMYGLLQGSNVALVQKLGAMGQAAGGSTRRAQKASVADGFAASMTNLCATLKSSNCSFIRCIKPNPDQKPLTFDAAYALGQVRALGLVQVCEVMKVGLPARIPFSEVRHLMGPVALEAEEMFSGDSPEVFMSAVLWALDIPDDAYEIGKTKIFFRIGHLDCCDKLYSTDFMVQRERFMDRLREAVKAHNDAKEIVDGLNMKLCEVEHQLVENKSALDKVVEVIGLVSQKVEALSTDLGILKSTVADAMGVLSEAHDTVRDVELNGEDLASGEHQTEYLPVKDIISRASSVLATADEISKEIDDNASTIEDFCSSGVAETVSSNTADLSEALCRTEAMMPDVRYLVNKTVTHANRCGIKKMESRADDCNHNLSLIKLRLAHNLSAVQSAGTEVNGVLKSVCDMLSTATMVKDLVSQTNAYGPEVKGICEEARRATASLRAKLVNDEEERIAQEEEARAREEADRKQREMEELSAIAEQKEKELAEAIALEERLRLSSAEESVSHPHSFSRGEDVSGTGNLPLGWTVRVDPNTMSPLYINTLSNVSQSDRPIAPAKMSLLDETLYSGSENVSGNKSVHAHDLRAKLLDSQMQSVRSDSPDRLDMDVEVSEDDDETYDAEQSLPTEIESSSSFQRVFKKGILLKQGKYFGSWRRLFFVLEGSILEHYSSSMAYMSGAPATKQIRLTGKAVLSYTKYNLCFTVSTGGRTTWIMMADNQNEFDKWMKCLNTVIGGLFDQRIKNVLNKSPKLVV